MVEGARVGEGGPSTTLSPKKLSDSVDLLDLPGGRRVSWAVLKDLLPDRPTALFFAKAYQLPARQVAEILHRLFRSSVSEALINEGDLHSSELQDYLLDEFPTEMFELQGIGFSEDAGPPDTELLGELFEQALVQVAGSIQEVADKLGEVLESFPSKYGSMTFQHLHRLNRQRATIGTYEAQIVHTPVPPRLVVLDVSGSMTEQTIRTIVDEVVGLAYEVDAALAIVSTNAFFWEAGAFSVADVLAKAEYGGTHYESLLPIFDRNWDTVVTIADYDSSAQVKKRFQSRAKGRVREVFDISLVSRPTFLAECVGTLASKVTPLLVSRVTPYGF